MDQKQKAEAFRSLHHAPELLVLPNAWDAVSAKVLQAAGFPAIASASASVSWSRGARDGEGLTRDDMIDAVGLIAGSVDCPVSADIEKGFGDSPADVGISVAKFIAAGAVGINIEDSVGKGQRPVDDMQARIAAATRRRGSGGRPVGD